jgi:hypothetical protein
MEGINRGVTTYEYVAANQVPRLAVHVPSEPVHEWRSLEPDNCHLEVRDGSRTLGGWLVRGNVSSCHWLLCLNPLARALGTNRDNLGQFLRDKTVTSRRVQRGAVGAVGTEDGGRSLKQTVAFMASCIYPENTRRRRIYGASRSGNFHFAQG